MPEKEYLTGMTAPTIRVDRSEKDLLIEGWSEPRIVIEADEDPKVDVSEQGIVISATDDLCIRAPFAAKIEVLWAGGDVIARDIKSTIVIHDCMGDATVRHCEGVDAGAVHGDLKVRDIGGDLKARTVSGDAKLRHVLGEVELEADGDIRIEHPVARAQLRAGGDASVAILPKPGSANRITAHGDLRCYLPSGASVAVDGKAGGDTFVRVPPAGKESNSASDDGSLPITIGKGEARLTLEAEGDLWIGGWMDVDSWGEWRELGRDMGQMGMEFGMLAGEFGRWVERNMHDKFNEYDKRMRRKMEENKFSGDRRRATWNAAPTQPQAVPGASEKERLSILEMLQNGKISVDEAERLLSTLEKSG
jgi:hypothetical protein